MAIGDSTSVPRAAAREAPGAAHTDVGGAGSPASPAKLTAPKDAPLAWALSRADASTSTLLTVIDGGVYDLTGFQASHPGGSDLLQLAAGRDASLLVRSYHRRDARFAAALARLPRVTGARAAAFAAAVLAADPNSRTSFPAATPLHDELKAAVNAYLAGRAGVAGAAGGASGGRGGLFMVAKSIALLTLTAAVWYAAVPLHVRWAAPLFGILLAVNGLSIQHDANHGALTRWPAVNAAFAFVDDIIGGSALLWRHQHVVAHHIHPNDVELDADSYGNWPLVRFNPAARWRPWHAWQHLYAPLLYCAIGVTYPLSDLADMAARAHAHVPLQPRLRLRDVALFVVGKVLHYSLTIGAPLALLGLRDGALHFWLPMQAAGGFFLASSFAVSHNVPAALYNAPRGARAPTATGLAAPDLIAAPPAAPAMEWAEMQIRTSANWAPDSTLNWACWLWGGLNYQIEHHLFPGICHEHYPALSKIVRRVCAARGIPYNAWPSYPAIFAAHLAHLRALGVRPATPGGAPAEGGVHGSVAPSPHDIALDAAGGGKAAARMHVEGISVGGGAGGAPALASPVRRRRGVSAARREL